MTDHRARIADLRAALAAADRPPPPDRALTIAARRKVRDAARRLREPEDGR